MKSIIKDTTILFLITLIAGTLLGTVHHITEEPIRIAKLDAKAKIYSNVFPEGTKFISDNELTKNAVMCTKDTQLQTFGKVVSIQEANLVFDDDNDLLGFVILTGAKGYNDQIQIATGLTLDGEITGIGFIHINETPGLGLKAKNDEFTSQFSGLNTDHYEFQALSGATFTSNAVKANLDAAVYFFNNYTEKWRIENE